jgi:uncharacterized protein (DUF927 family)
MKEDERNGNNPNFYESEYFNNNYGGYYDTSGYPAGMLDDPKKWGYEPDVSDKSEIVATPEKKLEVAFGKPKIAADPEQGKLMAAADPEQGKLMVAADPEQGKLMVVADPEQGKPMVVVDPEQKLAGQNKPMIIASPEQRLADEIRIAQKESLERGLLGLLGNPEAASAGNVSVLETSVAPQGNNLNTAESQASAVFFPAIIGVEEGAGAEKVCPSWKGFALSTKDLNELMASRDVFYSIFQISNSVEQNIAWNELKAMAIERGAKPMMFNGFKKAWSVDYGRYKNLLKAQADSERTELDHGPLTKFIGQPIALHTGEWDTDAFGIKSRDKGDKDAYVLRQPLTIESILIDRQTNNQKVKLAFLFGNTWQSVYVPRNVAQISSEIVKLANIGLAVSSQNSRQVVGYLNALLTNNDLIIPKKPGTSQMGWVEGEHSYSFSPYFGEEEFTGEDCYKTLFDSVTTKGSKDVWLAHMKKIRKNTVVRLATSASAASAIMKVIDGQVFIVHIWGKSEIGKSVALTAAASMWGNPELGKLVFSLNNTINFFMRAAAILNSIPFFGDELQTIKDYEVGASYDKFVMNMCQSVGRGIALKEGGVLVGGSWSNVVITSGEEPLTQINSGGGAKNRSFEACVTGQQIFEDCAETVEICKHNYGWLGADFTKEIDSKRTEIQLRYKELRAELGNYNSTKKQAASLAAILMADELLRPYFGEEPLELSEWASFLKEKDEVDVSERAYNWLIDNIAATKTQFTTGPSESAMHGETLGRIPSDGNLCYYNYSKLNSRMKAEGFSLEAVLPEWAEKKYIQPYIDTNGKHRYTRYSTLAGVKVGCLWINMPQDNKLENEG